MATEGPARLVGAANPLTPGAPAIGQAHSFLAQVTAGAAAGVSAQSARQFLLPSGIVLPLAAIEDRFTQAVTGTVQGLFSRAMAVREAAGPLLSGTPPTRERLFATPGLSRVPVPPDTLPAAGVFGRRRATSTDAAVQASAADDATRHSYQVDVLSLQSRPASATTAQQKTGTALSTTLAAPTTLADDTATVRLTTYPGGVASTTDITFSGAYDITSADRNADALMKIAAAINGSAAGSAITATLQTTAGGASQLVLLANTAGEAGQFDVADLTGSVAATAGIGTAARVRIDGVEYDAPNNLLTLDAPNSVSTGRLTLALTAVTSQTATVGVGVELDPGQVVDATQKLAAAVNDLNAFVAETPDVLSKGLLSRLNVVMGDLKAPLASIGITAASGGAIAVDEPRLRRALGERPAEVERTIGYVNGFASRELAVANAVVTRPGLAFAGRPAPLDVQVFRSLALRSALGVLVDQEF